jgi:hypothetical protein
MDENREKMTCSLSFVFLRGSFFFITAFPVSGDLAKAWHYQFA